MNAISKKPSFLIKDILSTSSSSASLSLDKKQHKNHPESYNVHQRHHQQSRHQERLFTCSDLVNGKRGSISQQQQHQKLDLTHTARPSTPRKISPFSTAATPTTPKNLVSGAGISQCPAARTASLGTGTPLPYLPCSLLPSPLGQYLGSLGGLRPAPYFFPRACYPLDPLDAQHHRESPYSVPIPLPVYIRTRSPPTSDNFAKPKKCRRSRTVFTELQLMGLEKKFETQKYLSTPDRMELAETLGLSQIQVKTWYQNRRMKWKKQVMLKGGTEPPTKPKGRPKKTSLDVSEELACNRSCVDSVWGENANVSNMTSDICVCPETAENITCSSADDDSNESDVLGDDRDKAVDDDETTEVVVP